MSDAPMIQMINVNKWYGDFQVLKDISLTVAKGERVVICEEAAFNADNCPAASQVGTVSTKVKALSLLDLTIPGSVDVLTADNGQVATHLCREVGLDPGTALTGADIAAMPSTG